MITNKLTSYRESFAYNLRSKRITPFIKLVEYYFSKYGRVDVLDIGGTPKYWQIIPPGFLVKHKVNITLVNIDKEELALEDTGIFTSIQANACNMDILADNSFHIVHSNSVMEHLGGWQSIVAFTAEVKRLAPSYYIQTPNLWFPIEPHFMTPFIHWLPVLVRARILQRFELGHYPPRPDLAKAIMAFERINLLDKKYMTYLFPEAKYIPEKFMGLTKSLIMVKQAE